jgi:hypothetical protein
LSPGEREGGDKHGPATEKVTVTRPDNCSGISFQRQDDPSNWATIAYNVGS